MFINCFCSSPAGGKVEHEDEAPRVIAGKKRILSRQRTGGSIASRASSNSTLPPPLGKRESDPRIEALMMPLPPEAVPSRCLRLSQPRTYSAIIDGMKATKGCRDWRTFSCFPDDDVDETLSAEKEAEKRRKLTAAKCVREAALAQKYQHLYGGESSDASSVSSDSAVWQE